MYNFVLSVLLVLVEHKYARMYKNYSRMQYNNLDHHARMYSLYFAYLAIKQTAKEKIILFYD